MWRLLQRCVKAGVDSTRELFPTENLAVDVFEPLQPCLFVSGASHAPERGGNLLLE